MIMQKLPVSTNENDSVTGLSLKVSLTHRGGTTGRTHYPHTDHYINY